MQQHDRAPSLSVRLLGVEPLKPDIIDRVKDYFLGSIQHGIIPPFPYAAAGQHGLDKGASEMERWIKNFVHSREEAATSSSSFTLSAAIDKQPSRRFRNADTLFYKTFGTFFL
jgi:hypothetical protein